MIFGYISMAVLLSSCNGVPMSIVNHRSSGVCKAVSTVGFPKPLSASQVAAYRVQTTPVRYMFHYWKRHIRQK